MPASPPYALAPMDRGHLVNARGKSLYRALHRPQGTPARAWVICHALLEDGTFGFRSLVELADAAAAAGDVVLRFDYEGQGDSEGDATHLGLAHWVDDTASAVVWVRGQVPDGTPLVMVALGSGALVAARAAARVGADQLVLIDPVVSGRAWFEKCVKAHLTMQLSCYNKVTESAADLRASLQQGGTVSLLGQEVGAAFADSLQAAHLDGLLAAYGRRTDVIAVSRADRPGVPDDLLALGQQPEVTVTACQVRTFMDRSLRFWELPAPLASLCLDVVAAETVAS